MKANFLAALLSVVCGGLIPNGRAEDSAKLTGQVFIRTNGGDNIKLSLVEVDLYDSKVIEDALAKKIETAKPIIEAFTPVEQKLNAAADAAEKTASRAADAASAIAGSDDFDKALAVETTARAAADKADADRDKIRGELDYPISSFYLFGDLPQPLKATKTDADGKFEFDVPRGSYVLVAVSSRNAGSQLVGDSAVPKTEFYDWMVKVNVDSDKTVMLANDNLSSSGSPDSLVNTPDDEGYIATAMDGQDIQTLTALVPQLKERERQAELAPYYQDPQLAQRKAVELYPDLGIAGSDLNKEFVARMKHYQAEKKDFFSDPDWPIRLAKECSEDLAAKQIGVSGTSSALPSP